MGVQGGQKQHYRPMDLADRLGSTTQVDYLSGTDVMATWWWTKTGCMCVHEYTRKAIQGEETGRWVT